MVLSSDPFGDRSEKRVALPRWTLQGHHDQQLWFTASVLIKRICSVSGTARTDCVLTWRWTHFNPKSKAETISVTFS